MYTIANLINKHVTTHVRNKKKSFVSTKLDAGGPEKLEVRFSCI